MTDTAASGDWIDRAAENWAAGVRAAASKTARNRTAAQAVSVANRARGAKTLCGVAGCKRHAFKGRLCRKHYALVPVDLKRATMIAVWRATMSATERAQRRYLPAVRAILAQQAKSPSAG